MTTLPHQPAIVRAKVHQFLSDIYNNVPRRSDAIVQLIESLACAEGITSVVALSQEPAFQRTFSNIHKAIDAMSASARVPRKPLSQKNTESGVTIDPELFSQQTFTWTKIFAERLPEILHKSFSLFALDSTATARPYSQTLEDRTFVHMAGQMRSPVGIGLQASVLVALPELVVNEAKWTLPLSIRRISSRETPSQVAADQLRELSSLFCTQETCVIVADCGYTALTPQAPNQIMIARSRTDRTGRRPCSHKKLHPGRGRPRKYEAPIIRFVENIPKGELGGPDEEVEHEGTRNGRPVFIFLSRWNDVYVHGQSDLVDVVKVEIFLKENLSLTLFEHPMLLIVSGQRRRELTSLEVYQSYHSRFDIEHFFRFQKQRMLLCEYQTPELHRQVNWWWICLMAYWLLYLVREIAPESNRPWAQKRKPGMTASPGEVKRVFRLKIFPDLTSPSKKPLSRGKSKGRAKGFLLPKRPRRKPIKKTAEKLKAA